jgi:hypothetical protein
MRTSSHRASRAVLRTVTALGLLASAIACGAAGNSDAKVAASARDAAGNTDSTPAVALPQRVGPPYQGTLPEPIQTIDAARFREFVSQKRYKGRTVDRDCFGEGCGPGASTRVRIEAIEDAYELDYITLPAKGVVVGRMRNVGAHRDVKYDGLPANDQNTMWYLLWTRAPGGRAFQRFVQLTQRDSGGPVMTVASDSFPVFHCREEHHWKESDAGFTDCRAGVARDSARTAEATSRTGTAWLSCAQGRCSADYAR